MKPGAFIYLSVKVSQYKMPLERLKKKKKSVYVLNDLLGSMVSLTLSVYEYDNTVTFILS